MTKQKKTKNQLIRIITQYGIHVWAILVIANAAMVYVYQFSTHAAEKKDTTLHTLAAAAGTPAPADDQPSVSPDAQGTSQTPRINLSFSVPGIGSGGGNMKPIHLKRSVIVFLYPTTVNSMNPIVKPLYSIKGSAVYDKDPNSPTYTSFINPSFDLGNTVKEGDYQISFRTDQSLRTVIKENPDDLGGKTYSLSKGGFPEPIPPQTVLMGDTIPDDGDNVVDATDYNSFLNCYGDKNDSSSCQGKNYGDFDDNGVIDGIDYNILLRSLNVIQQEGQTIPKVSGVPTPTPKQKAISKLTNTTPTIAKKKTKAASTSAKTKTTAKQTASSGSALGGILFFLFILILGVVGFVLYKKNEKVRNTIRAIIHRSPTGQPSSQNTEAPTETPAETPPGGTVVEATPGQTPVTEAPAETTAADIAASTELPIPAPVAETPAPTPAAPSQEQTPPQPSPAAAPAADGVVEKECYIKKKGADTAGTGEWLLLTDDNGPLEAHYAKTDAVDGFAKVKGVMKTENGKTFLEVSEITGE